MMANNLNREEELLEQLENKEAIIKKVNREFGEMERAKDYWYNQFLKEKMINADREEEVEFARKELKMFENRVKDAERKVTHKFEQKLQELCDEMKLEFEEREGKFLEELKAEHERREVQLLAIIEDQSSRMAAMEEAISKQKQNKYKAWFTKWFN